MRYRADIDGLRTVAVVPVVLFHAGLSSLSGGFVGVDVFFVISGYLITKLILADIHGPGFSVAHFYERRVRRIFPALSAVLMFCLAVGYAILAPQDYAQLGRSIVPVTLFASNFFFWKSTDYFSPDAESNLLLHSWSLSVEEQYYIAYPLLLVMLARWRKPMQPVLIAITLASLTLASVLVLSKPSATFYLLPTRAWELMAGGIVALRPRNEARADRINLAAATAGLAMILIPVMAYDRHMLFPGLAAVPPVLGAALIVWSGDSERATPVHRLLASRPFVFVGQASYSFYLWHFPLLVFAAYLYGGHLPLGTALLACALAFLMSLLSLRFVEKPFRRHGLTPVARRIAIASPILAMAAAAIAGLLLVRADGLPGRLDPSARKLLAVTEDRTRHHQECMSNGDVIVPPAQACRLGTPASQPSALLWGDSHAMVTATAMETEAIRKKAAFLFAASADCPIGIGFAISDTTERALTTTPSYRYCTTYNEEMLKRALADPAITTVVLSARWSNWRIGEPGNPVESPVDLRLVDAGGVAPSSAANRAIFERGFMLLLHQLTKAGKRVFLVGPLPEPSVSVPQALYVERFGLAPQLSAITLADYRRRHATILAMFEQVRAKIPTVRFIDPMTMLCDQSVRCPVSRSGIPVFFDHNHLSVDTARHTAPLYAAVFDRSSKTSKVWDAPLLDRDREINSRP